MASEDQTEEEQRSPFQAQADYDASLLDVYVQIFERGVIAPAKILWSDYRGRFGLLIVTIYILMGTVAQITVAEPQSFQGPILQGAFEGWAHPLGTTNTGQDLLSLMVHATPDMFKMMFAGAVFGNALGLTVGLYSGYLGGNVDKILMTMVDVLGSIPGLPLLLILVSIVQPNNPYVIGMIINIQGWTGLARAIRSQVLPLRNQEYVEASRAMGQSTSSVLMRQVLPDLLPYITIGFLGGATGVITASVGLYFIGILPFTTQNWGVVLDQAYSSAGALYSMDAVHWLLVPLVTISGLTFGLTLLAQAFDQVFNPRVRARHLARKQSDEGPDEEEDRPDSTSTTLSMGQQ